jgi:divalent metal cation (Fe/Co/Zn/Cd) transporter
VTVLPATTRVHCQYVVVTSAVGLLFGVEPGRSWLGIGVSTLAIVVMPWLAYRKRVLNGVLGSPALRADVAESVTCAYLAGVTLVGVLINAATGWWWVEHIAATLLLRWLIPEGREALESARKGGTAAQHG